jgi:hypothetical protein
LEDVSGSYAVPHGTQLEPEATESDELLVGIKRAAVDISRSKFEVYNFATKHDLSEAAVDELLQMLSNVGSNMAILFTVVFVMMKSGQAHWRAGNPLPPLSSSSVDMIKPGCANLSPRFHFIQHLVLSLLPISANYFHVITTLLPLINVHYFTLLHSHYYSTTTCSCLVTTTLFFHD